MPSGFDPSGAGALNDIAEYTAPSPGARTEASPLTPPGVIRQVKPSYIVTHWKNLELYTHDFLNYAPRTTPCSLP